MLATRSVAFWAIAVVASAKPGFFPGRVSLSTNQGFCSYGVNPTTTWIEDKPSGINAWGSYCEHGDETMGSAATAPFRAPAHLRIYLAGYPSFPGMTLRLQDLSNGSILSLQLREQPGEHWVPSDFSLPSSWRARMVRLVAEDNNTGPGGWVGFTEPLSTDGGVLGFSETRKLLLRTILHFVLLMLPCFA